MLEWPRKFSRQNHPHIKSSPGAAIWKVSYYFWFQINKLSIDNKQFHYINKTRITCYSNLKTKDNTILKTTKCYSRVPRLLDTRYSANGSKRELEIYKQKSEIVMRPLPTIAIYGYVGGLSVMGVCGLWSGRCKLFEGDCKNSYIY